MYHIFNEPKKIFPLIGETFKLWRASLRRTLVPSFIFVVLYTIQQVFVRLGQHKALALYQTQKALAKQQGLPVPQPHWSLLIPNLTVVVMMGVVLLAGWLLAAWVIREVDIVAKTKKEDMLSGFFFALKKWPFIVIAFIISNVLIVMGLFLFILPGIYLSVPLIFVFMAIVVDERSILSSFKRVIQLVWGKWWRTFGSLILVGLFLLVFFFVVAIIGLLGSILYMIIAKLIHGTSINTALWIAFGVSQLANLFFFPWIQSFLYVMYRNLSLLYQGS